MELLRSINSLNVFFLSTKGAKSVVIDFYKEILKGKSYSKALQKAKLNQIKQGELPIDWSSFVFIFGNRLFIEN